MTKRNLSKHQLRNIKKHKASYDDLCNALQGLVISHRGKLIELESSINETIFCQYHQNLGAIVAGDKVLYLLQDSSEYGIICQVLPRNNLLLRPSKFSHNHKTMAANINQIVIMLAVNPAPIEHYVDRYLVAANHMKIKPIIVINKIDLFSDAKNKVQLDNIIALYLELKYELVTCSALSHENLQNFKELLQHKTSIIVGQSGVGKSEMLNALFGKSITLAGEISEQNSRGKQTTTSARLFHLDQKTNIIDSPGIREFGIWHLDKANIFSGFKEFAQLNNECKFRNCAHLENTKGCAINEAVDASKISKQRFINYHRLIHEYLECQTQKKKY